MAEAEAWVMIPKNKNKGTEVVIDMRPLVLCKNCKHRDPENKKCDCGGMPWNTQIIPVPDDWFCPQGEQLDYWTKKCRECELPEKEKMQECQFCRER